VTCHCKVSTIQFTQNALRIKTHPNKGGNFKFLQSLPRMTPHSNATLRISLLHENRRTDKEETLSSGNTVDREVYMCPDLLAAQIDY